MTDPTLNNLSMTPLRESDHAKGSLDNCITLMAYGDYQSPRSGQACITLKTVQTSFDDQLCFVYRHFPQAAPHSSAWKAAEAAEVASDQGKFWEMHDLLSQNSQALEDFDLVSYADQVGLDIPKFLHGMANHTHAEKVQADIESAKASDVSDVPTFFITVRSQDTEHVDVLLRQLLEMTSSLSSSGEKLAS